MSYTLSKIRPDDRRGMAQVRALLEQEGVSLDGNLDYTCGLLDENDNLAATGSSFGSTLRCFAVDRAHQGEGLLNQIVSHLVERLTGQGRTHLFVYTKVSTAKFFQDLGFYEIARVEGTLSFLENRKNGFARFCARLDLALFGQIAKSLNITARYAGEEPSSQVTGLYNQVMARELPKEGIQFVEVPRKTLGEVPISASTVRKLIHDGNLGAIRPLVPEPTWQFFHTPEARPVIAAIQAAGNVIHY